MTWHDAQVHVELGSESLRVLMGETEVLSGRLYREVVLDGSTWFIGGC